MKTSDIKTLERGKYSIILKVDPWRARRHGARTTMLYEKNITLQEANKMLLFYFNYDFETCFRNWGLSVAFSRHLAEGALPTFSDGTRSYSKDGWCYYTELNDTIIDANIDRIS